LRASVAHSFMVFERMPPMHCNKGTRG
jgi:hypothetical protein